MLECIYVIFNLIQNKLKEPEKINIKMLYIKNEPPITNHFICKLCNMPIKSDIYMVHDCMFCSDYCRYEALSR